VHAVWASVEDLLGPVLDNNKCTVTLGVIRFGKQRDCVGALYSFDEEDFGARVLKQVLQLAKYVRKIFCRYMLLLLPSSSDRFVEDISCG